MECTATAVLTISDGSTDAAFFIIASPESLPLPADGDLCARAFLPVDEHGAGTLDGAAAGSLLFLLRGRVTLDAKVARAARVGAAALLILDVSGDPIGPDLDDAAPLFIGVVRHADCDSVLARLRGGGACTARLARAPASPLSAALARDVAALGALGGAAVARARDAAGHSALHFCAARDDDASLAALRAVLALGAGDTAFLDAADDVKRQTALHVAAKAGAARAAAALAAAGARALQRASDGRFPVHLARDAATLSVLRDAGHDLCARAADGATPLRLAAARGCVGATRFLVQAGAGEPGGAAAADKAAAAGAARAYLDDVAGAELDAFVTGRDARYVAELKAAAHSRFVADLGAHVDAADVRVEVVADTRCEVSGTFSARVRALRRTRCDAPDAPLAPLLFLWHGCDARLSDELIRGGFKTSFANLTFNVYGAGIYFATDAKLSSYFVTRNVREGSPLPPDAEGRYSLIFAAVGLGRTGVREALIGGTEAAKAVMKADLKHPANRNPPLGCDSATGVHRKEVVVYENALALPVARVSFRLRTPLPDPYSTDAAATGRTYLRALGAVPRGLGCFFDATGAPRALDGLPPDVDPDARLIMGWSAAARGAEPTVEELLERCAALELRVAALEGDNAALRRALAGAFA